MVDKDLPLAVRMRPKTLEEFTGQEHILGEGKLLRRAIESGRVSSVILWGPAGCGKTTLGCIIASRLKLEFEYLNAAFSTVSGVKKIIDKAKKRLASTGIKTLIFIDEIHRFNKLQQEILIPDTENGTITFVGATIYTPYYYLIPSLISRSISARFQPLTKEQISVILKQAIKDTVRGLGRLNIQITNRALEHIAVLAGGDARKALTSLEIGVLSTKPGREGSIIFNLEAASQSIQKDAFYDKKGLYHYDTISAFIKSIRGSDPDSALYWLAKMIKGGEDPRFIARRLVILASEDIGNADPFCLVLAASCFKAVEAVGYPEAQLILAQATIYSACAPKSNSCCKAIFGALRDAEEDETKEVPSHIKTHAKAYKYPHSYFKKGIGGFIRQDYGISKKYYFPLEIGQEKKLKEFLQQLRKH